MSGILGAKSMASDFAAIASGRLAAIALSLVSILLMTHVLGPAGYGAVSLVTVVSTLVFMVSTAWTATSVRRYGREALELRGTISRITWNRVLIGAPFISVTVALVILLEFFHALPGSLGWDLISTALAIAIAMIIVDHWTCLLETTGRMKLSATAQVLTQGLFAGTIVVVALIGSKLTVQLVLLFKLGALIVVVVGIAPAIWKVGVIPVAFDRQLRRRMLWLSVPLIGFTVSQYILASVDVVILRIFRSQAEVGIYAVAYQAYTMLSNAAGSANPVLVPLFVSLDMGGRRKLIEHYLCSAVPVGVFVISAIAGLGLPLLPVFVPIVFGHAFGGAAAPMEVLIVGLVLLFMGYLVAPILTLEERTRAAAVVNAVAAAINILGDVVMIGILHMGIIAPALATTGAVLFMAVAFYVLARDALGVDARPDPLLLAPLLVGLIPTLLTRGPLAIAAAVAASAASSLAIIRWRSPFNVEDAALIAKLDLPDRLKRAAVKLVTLAA